MRISVPARVVLAQFAVGVVGAVAWGSAGGARDALAALVGGSIGAASSTYLALRMGTAASTTTDAGAALGRFVWAWIVKIVVAVGLLYAAARWAPDALPAVVSTFVAALMVYPFALRWSE